MSSAANRRSEKSNGREPRRTSGANRRSEVRIKKRLPCEVVDGDKRVRGFVLDVSSKGMFVQTLKPIDPGGQISIAFTPPQFDQAIEVRACVVRSLRVPRHLASVAPAGVGLRIIMAPPEYFEFLESLIHRGEKPAKAGGRAIASEEPDKTQPRPKKRKLPARMPKPETRYRVQAKQSGGPRSRSLVVDACSLEQAESRALEQLGSDWEIVGVKGV